MLNLVQYPSAKDVQGKIDKTPPKKNLEPQNFEKIRIIFHTFPPQ